MKNNFQHFHNYYNYDYNDDDDVADGNGDAVDTRYISAKLGLNRPWSMYCVAKQQIANMRGLKYEKRSRIERARGEGCRLITEHDKHLKRKAQKSYTART